MAHYNVFVKSENPRASGHNARVGDLLVRTVESDEIPLIVSTVNTQAQRIDQAASVYEQVEDLGFVFSRFNHTGGEGLSWYPPRSGKVVEELDPIRFFDSNNLRIGREIDDVPYRVELARSFSVKDNSQAFIDSFSSNESIYYCYSLTIEQLSDWDDLTPTSHTLTGTTGPILSLFGSRSDDVCVITTEGDLFIKPRGATAFVLGYEAGVTGEALTAGWWVKGRVMAQRGKVATIDTVELLEINFAIGGTAGAPTATPTVSVIDTFDADVHSVVDTSIAIIAALSNGELRSYVPVTDAAGDVPVLTIKGTTPMPISEEPYNLGYGAGKLIILTTDGIATGRRRAYSAEVLDARFNFIVGQLQLLREWPAVPDQPDIRTGMVAARDSIWWTIDCELWGYDSVTTGLFREQCIVDGGEIFGLMSYQDILGGVVDGDLMNQSDQYQTSGYMITPNINFGRSGKFAWMNIVIEADNLGTADGYISVFYSTDPGAIYDEAHASWNQIATIEDISQSNKKLSLTGVESNSIAIKLVFTAPTTLLDTPRLLRYSLRGIPAVRDWQIQLPINISDLIEVPYRQPMLLPGWGQALFDELINMEGRHIELELFVPNVKFQGIVDAVRLPSEYLPDRGSPASYAIVELRGSKVSGSEQFTGSHSFGQTSFALALWSTGETEIDLV